ncbi:Carboxy-terminal domain (CTD) phosphatase [Podila minutissima]|uniref:RNA polymerase II subunit A C-terminal domain phosphatase n=1 Tax=Podila minutissima TaxID=64525 RepID=A0A9P5SR03_9FUNG|nr:Carboxy-terminal domain (CTD) phosphatase [Podila minutissima]
MTTATYYMPDGHLPATIIQVKTEASKLHDHDDPLIEYEYKEQVEGFQEEGKTTTLARRAYIRAQKDGTVGRVLVGKGDVIDDSSKPLLEYEPCSHDAIYGGMCVVCGKTITEDMQKTHVQMTHSSSDVSVSKAVRATVMNEAERMESATVRRLLEEEKLTLIVDLDQTLIHATVGTAIDEWINAQGEMPKDIRMFPLPDSPTPYYIKLRPHLEKFLERVAELYELHIYTMGTRNYADAVSNVIDPDAKYFSHRILSRDENHSMSRKSIERLFPCDNSMVVVLDDRADVWHYSPNLVKVHPYEYFVGAGDINAGHLPKQDATATAELTEQESAATPEEAAKNGGGEPSSTPGPKSGTPAKPAKPRTPVLDDNDNELENALEVLETIHEKFYDARENFKQRQSKHDADVKTVIRQMRSSVLHGVDLVFSGMIPLGVPQDRTDIWRQASTYGAICSTELNDRTTHIVARKVGTSKIKEAMRMARGIKVVKPEWLFHSFSKWQRQDETPYLLVEESSMAPISTTPKDDPIEESEDEDDGGVSEGMDENHEPLSVGNNFVNEGLKAMNWDDLEKEIEDNVSDLDDTDFDSDTSNVQSDASADGSHSPLVNLKRARVPRRSGLGVTVMNGSDDEDDGQEGPTMDVISSQDRDEASSDDSGSEIDEESGSDGDDSGSDSDGSSREAKRRRVDHGSEDDEEEEEEEFDDFLQDMEDDLAAEMEDNDSLEGEGGEGDD